MSLTILAILAGLAALLTLSSYVERIYAEKGRFLSREFQENIDAFEMKVDPRLRGAKDRAELSAALLSQLATAAIAMTVIYEVMYDQAWDAAEIAQAAVEMVLIIIVFNRLLPFILFTRTKGEWMEPLAPFLRILIYLLLPITVVVGFCQQIAALAEPKEPVTVETQADAVDALIEAGEEEGILEEGDRELIQSVVEFRDKTVREVMTPRPEIIAVPVDTTIEQFIELQRVRPFSRMPVYEGSIDDMKGLLIAHDVLQVSDTDAKTRTVAGMMRPIHFVPESKPVQDLMREMQKQNQHLAVVIDEYGSVAGVVTMEDLVEEIVGEIRDEHESASDVVREKDGSYVVPGSLDVDRLAVLFGVKPEREQTEATTVAGLVSEMAGRIPKSGEVFTGDGLRYEVLESTDRRVERLRIRLVREQTVAQSAAGTSKEKKS